jgi:hypothetical protein
METSDDVRNPALPADFPGILEDITDTGMGAAGHKYEPLRG